MYTAAVITALVALAAARPSPSPLVARDGCFVNTVSGSDATGSGLAAAVIQWDSDVKIVNAFLNEAGSLMQNPDALFDAAVAAKNSAQDEPCQLGTMINFNDQIGGFSPGFQCAIDDLKSVFDTHVLNNLQTIIDFPEDIARVNAAVDDINQTRCCNVLPDASLLWFDVQTSGTGLPTEAERPNACASIDCGLPDCKAKNPLAGGVF